MFNRTRLSVAIGAAFGIGLFGLATTATAQQSLDRVEVRPPSETPDRPSVVRPDPDAATR